MAIALRLASKTGCLYLNEVHQGEVNQEIIRENSSYVRMGDRLL